MIDQRYNLSKLKNENKKQQLNFPHFVIYVLLKLRGTTFTTQKNPLVGLIYLIFIQILYC